MNSSKIKRPRDPQETLADVSTILKFPLNRKRDYIPLSHLLGGSDNRAPVMLKRLCELDKQEKETER